MHRDCGVWPTRSSDWLFGNLEQAQGEDTLKFFAAWLGWLTTSAGLGRAWQGLCTGHLERAEVLILLGFMSGLAGGTGSRFMTCRGWARNRQCKDCYGLLLIASRLRLGLETSS